MKNQQGFTLVEGLITGGVIAIVIFIAGMSILSSRSRVRDYKRLSDISRIQASLELFFNETNEYPITQDGAIVLGQGGAMCLSSSGLTQSCPPSGQLYMNPIPSQTPDGISQTLKTYGYESNGKSYAISFIIEKDMPQVGLTEGLICAYEGQSMFSATGNTCPLEIQ